MTLDLLYAFCPVCCEDVRVIRHAVVDLNVRWSVTCHGSTETKTLKYVDLLVCSQQSQIPRAVEDWLRQVFTTDLQPDVMLAIRYGKGQTMKEPA